jgi:GxxExxY protein
MKEEIKDDLTYKIIGCAMKVHNILGNGFQEVIYQRALAIEMKNNGVEFVREREMPIFYEGEEIGTRRVDFLAEGEVLVELKALTKLEDVHLAQGLNYLVAYELDKGLLLNFGAQSLEIKRLRHPKNKQKPNIIQESKNPENLPAEALAKAGPNSDNGRKKSELGFSGLTD